MALSGTTPEAPGLPASLRAETVEPLPLPWVFDEADTVDTPCVDEAPFETPETPRDVVASVTLELRAVGDVDEAPDAA